MDNHNLIKFSKVFFQSLFFLIFVHVFTTLTCYKFIQFRISIQNHMNPKKSQIKDFLPLSIKLNRT
jgi:hypothetical protein